MTDGCSNAGRSEGGRVPIRRFSARTLEADLRNGIPGYQVHVTVQRYAVSPFPTSGSIGRIAYPRFAADKADDGLCVGVTIRYAFNEQYLERDVLSGLSLIG